MVNRRTILYLAVIFTFVFVSTFGSAVYAAQNNAQNGNQYGNSDRDQDYIEEPNHKNCPEGVVIECDQEQLRQRIRDCDNCPEECLQERSRVESQHRIETKKLSDECLQLRNRLWGDILNRLLQVRSRLMNRFRLTQTVVVE